MPNWCKGTLKIRGSKENILNFLKNELKCVDILGNDLGQPKIEFNEDYEEITVTSPDEKEYAYWIQGTRRNFIEEFTGGYMWEIDNDVSLFVCDNFKAAWGMQPEPYAELSQKYNLDFRIYGFERGMYFNQDIEILNGKITINEKIEYDDYNWECPFPKLGG